MKVVVLLLALLAMLGHAWLSHELGKDRLQALLEESMRAELQADPQFRGVDVTYDYLDGVLTGELPSKDLEELAQAFAEDKCLAGRISSEIKLGPPPDQPPFLAVEFDGAKFLLSGKLPDDICRSAVEDELRLLDRGQVVNKIEISNRIIRPKWDGMTSRVFDDFFREPGAARLEITAEEVRLKRLFEGGEARRKELLAAADPLKQSGLKVVDNLELIRDQPAELSAMRGANGRVTLSGRLGDAAERSRLLESLKPLLADDGSGLKFVESVVPSHWGTGLGAFLAEFMKLVTGGEALIEGNALSLKGQLPASKGKGEWLAKAQAAIGSEYNVEDHLALIPDLEPSLKLMVERNQVRVEGALPPGELANALAQSVKTAGFETFETGLKVSDSVKAPPWGAKALELIAFSLQQAGKGLQPTAVSFRPGLVTVQGIVAANAERESLFALAKSVVPESWALEFSVEVKSLQSPMVAGEVRDDGTGIIRGTVPRDGLIEEIRAFAKARTGKPLEVQLASGADVRAPSWKGKFAPFLDVFFREVKSGSFELGDQGWVLAGVVASEDAKRHVLAEAEKLVGPGMPLRDGLRVAIPAEPYLVVAEQVADGWKFSGRVPNAAARDALKSGLQAQKSTAEVTALSLVPAVQPPPWAAKIPDFLREAGARLTEARIGMEDAKLTLEGKHRKMEGKEEFAALAKSTFGEKVTIDDKTWIPKPEITQPARLRVTLQPTRVVLAGDLDNSGTADTLVAGARAALPKAQLVNELKTSPQFAKAEWVPIVSGFLPSFVAATTDGEIEVEGQQVTLRGKAKSESSRDSLLAAFAKALPNTLSLRDELIVLQQPSAADRADTYTVYFGSASTFINIKGQQTLATAAAAIKDADKKSTILIKGHADALGDDAANLELSRDRAKEVYDELVKAGVDPKQLEFIGVGEAESHGRSRFDLRYDRKVEIKLVR